MPLQPIFCHLCCSFLFLFAAMCIIDFRSSPARQKVSSSSTSIASSSTSVAIQPVPSSSKVVSLGTTPMLSSLSASSEPITTESGSIPDVVPSSLHGTGPMSVCSFLLILYRRFTHNFIFITTISRHGSSLGVESKQPPQSRLSPLSDELSSPIDPPHLSSVPPAPAVPVTPVPSAKACGKKRAAAPKDAP